MDTDMRSHVSGSGIPWGRRSAFPVLTRDPHGSLVQLCIRPTGTIYLSSSHFLSRDTLTLWQQKPFFWFLKLWTFALLVTYAEQLINAQQLIHVCNNRRHFSVLSPPAELLQHALCISIKTRSLPVPNKVIIAGFNKKTPEHFTWWHNVYNQDLLSQAVQGWKDRGTHPPLSIIQDSGERPRRNYCFCGDICLSKPSKNFLFQHFPNRVAENPAEM